MLFTLGKNKAYVLTERAGEMAHAAMLIIFFFAIKKQGPSKHLRILHGNDIL